MNKINEITEFISVIIASLIIFIFLFHPVWLVLLLMHILGLLVYIWVLFKLCPYIYIEIRKYKKNDSIKIKKSMIFFVLFLGCLFLILGFVFIVNLYLFFLFLGLFFLCLTVFVYLLSIFFIEAEI